VHVLFVDSSCERSGRTVDAVKLMVMVVLLMCTCWYDDRCIECTGCDCVIPLLGDK
jgi:hypothetical protein